LQAVIVFFDLKWPQKSSPQFLCSACLSTRRSHRTYFFTRNTAGSSAIYVWIWTSTLCI